MKGIVTAGIYLPYYRIKREVIFRAMSWFNAGTAALAKGEKTVANSDEDSITLAVAAGMECLVHFDRKGVDALYAASTTFPYNERGNASIAIGALNLSPHTRGVDYSGSLKCGTTALITALLGPESETTLICASDCRLGTAGGAQEQLLGDGAAAFIVSNKGVDRTSVG